MPEVPPATPGPASGTEPSATALGRSDFPILASRVGGHPLVYLDNAATTQKPRAVLDAIQRYYEQDNANIHRGVHALSQRATDAYEAARETVREFLGARTAAEIIFTRNATEAVNLVAQTFGRTRLGRGDNVVLTRLEHHANIVPWQILAEEKGFDLRVVSCDGRGVLDLDHYRDLLDPRTRLASFVHVSNALGTINPAAEMIALARARGIPTLLDAAQAVQHLPVDVTALGCDFLVLSGHKVYGPTGIGILYGRAEILRGLPPYQGGGDMIRSVSFEKTTFKDIPDRFEAGTPHIAGAIGLAAALRYLQGLGMERIAAAEETLLQAATARLSAIPGVRLVGTAPRKCSVLSFLVEGVHPHDVGTFLDAEGIAIRAGHHCTQPLMRHLGIPGTARASFSFYNSLEDVERLSGTVAKLVEFFRTT